MSCHLCGAVKRITQNTPASALKNPIQLEIGRFTSAASSQASNPTEITNSSQIADINSPSNKKNIVQSQVSASASHSDVPDAQNPTNIQDVQKTQDSIKAIEIIDKSPQTRGLAPIEIVDLRMINNLYKAQIKTHKNLLYDLTIDINFGIIRELKLVQPKPKAEPKKKRSKK